MANKGSKDDFASTANAPGGRVATPAQTRDLTGGERGPQRNRQARRREPLHAFIVHFDVEPSSKPPFPEDPD
ncbi:hypothetical protein [Paraburkholderia silvatlantica]|uniref:Uncharacterized protein n=1 Tax=Paraburkholderia silvatlantica TaxID=321895 RepID=A0ABR6FJS6_9BURK|nr:hypothetical protein [Paraburkholderia silvatlantica]MBB2927680.1 hypothetical protein [Paraburkholderia silvatlantica]PVY36388.1 hypothetical protein C7411_103260 [Paraburkholderia silvatlantica]PXW40195.1 hypothetical protein C7413_10457 [Paraburkholderia silvatlantica]